MARLSTLLASSLAFLLLQTLVNAQNIASLPQCAQDCANIIATAIGCAPTDITCLCQSKTFATATLQCSAQRCSQQDQSSAIGTLASICNSGTATAAAPITTAASAITSTSPLTSATDSLSMLSSMSSASSSIPLTSSTLLTTTSDFATLSMPPSSATSAPAASTSDSPPIINAAAAGMAAKGQIGAIGAVVVALFVLL
ncbi:hypothetical protein LshimejAT787_0411740 [Lyophyllum shimeji]|uniref:CFEM domain-containing protein n=1 Tax=Lyophyllum shimeji TaxID=47721 RepID=A0A9P3ULY4_LYOSH|nr:hypothetical protein LshimejAT787_0411740 [Lyophyllum shimeji]